MEGLSMINKNFIPITLLVVLSTVAHHTYGAELGAIKESVEETITQQNVNFYFYDHDNNKIANLEYCLKDETTIYLSYIKIYDRNNRGNSLGKQLFTYFINHVKERNPAITTITWQAVALDEQYMSQKKLEAWYTARGGVKVGRHPSGNGSLFKLKVRSFKPEINLSSLLALRIAEDCSIKGTTEIELKNRRDDTIAKLGFLLSVKNDKYSLKIDDLEISPAYAAHKTEIQRRLRTMVVNHMKAKEWLDNFTAKIKTNGILPTFTL